MTEHIEQQNSSISAAEVLRTEIIINQALIDILLTKQIISEDELLNSIQKIKLEQKELLSDSNKIVSLKR